MQSGVKYSSSREQTGHYDAALGLGDGLVPIILELGGGDWDLELKANLAPQKEASLSFIRLCLRLPPHIEQTTVKADIHRSQRHSPGDDSNRVLTEDSPRPDSECQSSVGTGTTDLDVTFHP